MNKSICPSSGTIPTTKWYPCITRKPSGESILTTVYCLVSKLPEATSYLDETYALPLSSLVSSETGPFFRAWLNGYNTHLAYAELDGRTWWALCFERLDTRPSENHEYGCKCNRCVPRYALKIFFVPYQAVFFPVFFFQGGVHRLESVEEYNELMVRNGDPRARMLEVSRDGRKHSLPQLLDSGASQVAQSPRRLPLSHSQSWPVSDGRACFHPGSPGFLLFFQQPWRASMFWRTARPWARSIWD